MSFKLVVGLLSLVLFGLTVAQESDENPTSPILLDVSASLSPLTKLLRDMMSAYGYPIYNDDYIEEYEPPTVFFKAFINESEENYQTGMEIVFPHVLLNEENGYNATSGKFTAPASGLYQFTVHACHKSLQRAAFAIIHQGKEVVQLTLIVGRQHTCVSAGALVQMQEREMAWVNSLADGCYIYSSDHSWPSFNGELIKTID